VRKAPQRKREAKGELKSKALGLQVRELLEEDIEMKDPINLEKIVGKLAIGKRKRSIEDQ